MIAELPRTNCLTLAALLVLFASDVRAQRYVALMRDGGVRTGQRVEFDQYRPLQLDGKSLLDAENPIRVLRDTAIAPAAPGPHIELTNGDLLRGRATGVVTGPAAAPWPDYLLVESTSQSGQVRVRLDWVRKIVAHRRTSANYSPGYLQLSDGRNIASRSTRWAEGGVKALTDDGILHLPFEQIAEWHAAQSDAWLPPLPGAELLAGKPPAVVRMQTADGDVLTIPHAMVTKDFEKPRGRSRRRTSMQALATRPPWSLDTVLFDSQAIVFQTFLEDDELPLSLLPLVDEQRESAVQHLAWQRNRNVHGGVLQCGGMAAELGIGMHSHSRLTFALPRGAKRFTSHVGLDRAAGDGGCVHCRIFADDDPRPRWERKFLRGSDGLQTVEPIDIAGAKTLTLEVDFADKDRPQGADPLDIRDWVDWLLPTVVFEKPRAPDDLTKLVPELAGWTVSADVLPHLSLHPAWIKKNECWGMAIDCPDEPLVLARRAKIDLTNAWLYVQAARDDKSGSRYELRVSADGENVGSTMNGPVRTHEAGKFFDRVHILHEQAGREVELKITVEPYQRDDREALGVIFGPLQLQPLVRHLPADGQPIEPDVPLTSLVPVRAVHQGKPLALLPGKVGEQVSLNIRDWQFTAGYGVPTGSEITYKLDPAWRTFVAIVGLADGWHGVGPYQILLDGKAHWTSEATFARNDQGEQIAVPIPQGHQTITLRVLGQESGAAFAHAGFVQGE